MIRFELGKNQTLAVPRSRAKLNYAQPLPSPHTKAAGNGASALLMQYDVRLLLSSALFQPPYTLPELHILRKSPVTL